jgi:hypothetical protein
VAEKARRAVSARPQFKEPAALKRLGTSLDGAEAALKELRKSAGRDINQGSRALYKDLGSVLSTARRHSRKLSTALKRDFEQASKVARSHNQPTQRKTTARPKATAPKTTARRSAK